MVDYRMILMVIVVHGRVSGCKVGGSDVDVQMQNFELYARIHVERLYCKKKKAK